MSSSLVLIKAGSSFAQWISAFSEPSRLFFIPHTINDFESYSWESVWQQTLCDPGHISVPLTSAFCLHEGELAIVVYRFWLGPGWSAACNWRARKYRLPIKCPNWTSQETPGRPTIGVAMMDTLRRSVNAKTQCATTATNGDTLPRFIAVRSPVPSTHQSAEQ